LLGESMNIDSLNMHIKLWVARRAQINNEFFQSILFGQDQVQKQSNYCLEKKNLLQCL
jgi:hypothetical protein